MSEFRFKYSGKVSALSIMMERVFRRDIRLAPRMLALAGWMVVNDWSARLVLVDGLVLVRKVVGHLGEVVQEAVQLLDVRAELVDDLVVSQLVVGLLVLLVLNAVVVCVDLLDGRLARLLLLEAPGQIVLGLDEHSVAVVQAGRAGQTGVLRVRVRQVDQVR